MNKHKITKETCPMTGHLKLRGHFQSLKEANECMNTLLKTEYKGYRFIPDTVPTQDVFTNGGTVAKVAPGYYTWYAVKE